MNEQGIFKKLMKNAQKEVNTTQRVAKKTQVQNKDAAPVQISAEQILREALDRKDEMLYFKPPTQKIMDKEEMDDYRFRKRKEFEDKIRFHRYMIKNYLMYAAWEENQGDFERARSIFERALEIDYRDSAVWLVYAKMEMRNGFLNHARNLFERSSTLLPRVDKLWYNYVRMEELLGNLTGCRDIFAKWMKWKPEPQAWKAYIALESKFANWDIVRKIYNAFVENHNEAKIWLSYAKFEQQNGTKTSAREVFERALNGLSGDNPKNLGEPKWDAHFFMKFAKFEENCEELERARSIFAFALDNLHKSEVPKLFQEWIAFEKRKGDSFGIEQAIVAKRRFQYEKSISANALDYNVWFDYLKMEEEYFITFKKNLLKNTENSPKTTETDEKVQGRLNKELERIRDLFERSIANIPLLQEKPYWKRYIYLWIHYSIFEELFAEDVEKTRNVFQQCIRLIPHSAFSFAKIWILFARFELRQKDLKNMRLVFGNALGMCPKKAKIYKEYINVELLLGNVDRVRVLYEKYLNFDPTNGTAWKNFAELETKLREFERVEAIYETAVKQPILNLPEIVWKSYIDFESLIRRNKEKTRSLYERLLEKTKHAKVWVSFALFEISEVFGGKTKENIENARKIFSRGEEYLQKENSFMEDEENEGITDPLEIEEREMIRKVQRAMILEKWLEFEKEIDQDDNSQNVSKLEKKQPKTFTKKRKLESGGFEEYTDYEFPKEQEESSSKLPKTGALKILEMAHKWKQQKAAESQPSS